VSRSPTAPEQTIPPTLRFGELRLRPLRVGDEAALFEYLSDPSVTEHTSIPTPTLQSLATAVQRDVAAYGQRTAFRLALTKADDHLIGVCGFNSWSPAHRHAELAYELARQYWGLGYMRRAINTLLTWGYSDLGLNRVHAFVMTTNARSIRLLECCGFAHEGTLQQYRIVRGEPKDFHLYALLAQDFTPTLGGALPNASYEGSSRP
jgi:ribosomal-protein-alanine N-acetyltransferase